MASLRCRRRSGRGGIGRARFGKSLEPDTNGVWLTHDLEQLEPRRKVAGFGCVQSGFDQMIARDV